MINCQQEPHGPQRDTHMQEGLFTGIHTHKLFSLAGTPISLFSPLSHAPKDTGPEPQAAAEIQLLSWLQSH